jgi:hypothetical protein
MKVNDGIYCPEQEMRNKQAQFEGHEVLKNFVLPRFLLCFVAFFFCRGVLRHDYLARCNTILESAGIKVIR